MAKDLKCTLKIRVTPKSAKNALIGWEEETLRLRLAAVPEKGAANKELIKYLAKLLNIAKSNISIIAGETSRDKIINIDGLTLSDVKHSLSKYLTA